MATSESYIKYVCEQLRDLGDVRAKKMFGEYMIYLNDKPVAIVCDGTFYVKKLEKIETLCESLDVGCPYKGAKEHYILDIDDKEFCKNVLLEIFKVLPTPKKK